MSDRPSLHARAFLLLLRLYPRAFREEHAQGMLELFELRLERRRQASGVRALVGLWAGTVVDVGRTAAAEWMDWDGVSADRSYARQARKGDGMTSMTQEIRDAARRLVRTPLFSLAAIAIVALGIGANTAAFTLVNTILLRPPPWDEPERVVYVYQDSDEGEPNSTSFPAYRDMTEFTDVFESVTATTPTTLTWEVDGVPRPAAVEFVTASYLPTFGLSPALGRWFESGYDQVGAGNYAVVSYRTWLESMGADPDVVGRTIRLNDEPVTVIGVGPRSFNGNMGAVTTDFWLSISSVGLNGAYMVTNLDRREDHWYDIKARLAPGVTVERAQAAMTALADRLAEQFPALNEGRDITVFAYGDVRLHPEADAGLMPVAVVIMGVVGLVLALACGNLANLLLVRGMSRAPEVALRRALGASRFGVARLFMVEALMLAGLGGALGLLVARWGLGLAPRLPVDLPIAGTLDLAMDARVFGFAFLLALATGALFGLIPALRAAGGDVSGALREDTRSASPGRKIAFFRNSMVAVQVAASIILVVGSGLLVRSLVNLQAAGAGVDADQVAYLGVDLSSTGITPEEGPGLWRQIRERFEAVPGVTAAALTTRLPVENRGGSTTTVIEGYDPPTGTGAVELVFSFVGPDYFEVVGQTVIQGRAFSDDDVADAPRVAILNETAARRYWGDADPIGRRIRSQSTDAPWTQVVGIVADAKVRSLGEAPTAMLYRPAGQARIGAATVVARTDSDPAAMAATMREALRDVRSDLTTFREGSLEEHVRAGLAPSRTAALVLGSFSALALLLASLGIYAVVSFAVARRSSELGIRIALGAARGGVILTVLREMMVTVAFGLAVGLGVAAFAASRIGDAIPGVGSFDPAAFLGGALLLTLVAGVASYLPARRAAVADPVVALRAN